MDRGVYIAAVGCIGQDRVVDVIANNLAGSDEVGFKKDLPVFKVYSPEVDSSIYTDSSEGNDMVFALTKGIVTDISQGEIKETGNPLDLAISGDGFFVVKGKEKTFYTRRGDFVVDKDGRLSTKDGYLVQGEGGVITLTSGEVSVGEDGTVSVDGEEVGRIKLVSFKKPDLLEKAGAGLFRLKDSKAQIERPKNSSILQGHLEMSNVDAVKEMVSMITALRAYESHMRLIKAFDEMTENSIRLANG